METKNRRWSERPLDLLYITFFLFHIPATLLVDLQGLYPTALVPAPLRRIPASYIRLSNDPLIAGALGLNGPRDRWVWFHALTIVEAFFQLPALIAGIHGLWNDSRSIYTLLLIYATSACVTTFPCLAVILTAPSTSVPTPTSTPDAFALTPAQRGLLLSGYIPFILVPALMAVDMASRIARLIKAGANAENANKAK